MVGLHLFMYDSVTVSDNGGGDGGGGGVGGGASSHTVTVLARRGGPRLVPLPPVYFSFFIAHRASRLPDCKCVGDSSADADGFGQDGHLASSSAISERAVCLLCGEVMCTARNCCVREWGIEAEDCLTAHTRRCSLNCGVFMLLHETSVVVLLGRHRFCKWGPLFLDKFGEPDLGMRRGQTVRF